MLKTTHPERHELGTCDVVSYLSVTTVNTIDNEEAPCNKGERWNFADLQRKYGGVSHRSESPIMLREHKPFDATCWAVFWTLLHEHLHCSSNWRQIRKLDVMFGPLKKRTRWLQVVPATPLVRQAFPNCFQDCLNPDHSVARPHQTFTHSRAETELSREMTRCIPGGSAGLDAVVDLPAFRRDGRLSAGRPAVLACEGGRFAGLNPMALSSCRQR
ncbi:hypothetical protein AWB76_05652 [Caballeronia temeraria]|uniref:Uncharacterized protein n=1 Tax=Caballeronia temeraria TaxID=1777137 RepID=A0A158CJR7_9BURK|nr:hypothetical protein AWB76_05652 [Caballeronia temeraria]